MPLYASHLEGCVIEDRCPVGGVDEYRSVSERYRRGLRRLG
jgi:hypothetical protein